MSPVTSHQRNIVGILVLILGPADLLAAECEPTINAASIQTHVNARNSEELVGELLANTTRSASFAASQGNEGLRKAIADMISNLFKSRTVDSPDLDETTSPQIAAKLSEGIKAACETLAKGESDQAAAKAAIKAAKLTGGDSQYFVLLGTTNSLEGDGGFSTGLEASLMSTTNFPFQKIPLIRHLSDNDEKMVAGTWEMTFSEIGGIDEQESGQSDAVNPFAVGGGFLRLSMSADTYFSGGDAISGLGVRLGGGFSTQPSTPDSDVDTRARGYGGLVFRANYGKDDMGRQGKGEVFIGYAKDKFWKYDTLIDDSTTPPTVMQINETDRLVVDARMDVPHVFQSEEVRLHARVFADLPASGDGPSDVRISLLLTVNLGAFFPVN